MPISKSPNPSVIRPLKMPEITPKPQKSPPNSSFLTRNHSKLPQTRVHTPASWLFSPSPEHFFKKKPQMPILKSSISSVIRPLKMPEIVQKPQKSPPKRPFFIGNCLFRHKPVSASPSLNCFRRHQGAVERWQTFGDAPKLPETAGRQLGFSLAWKGQKPILRGFIGGKRGFEAILRYLQTKNERFRRKNERVWSKNGWLAIFFDEIPGNFFSSQFFWQNQ
jgi:hypothetical protein